MGGCWFVLGFTPDDVVMASQDLRLAYQVASAWAAQGCPEEIRIVQARGEEPHLLHWFVNAAAAALLDEKCVAWRRFLIGERSEPPTEAVAVLRPGAPPP